MRNNHKWEEWERDIVRREYRHNRDSVLRIADILGVTANGVRGQIAIMGLSRKDLRKPWTEAEKERLRELMPTYCPRRVAQMMHRGLNSVVVMSKRLGVRRRHRNGWYTKQEAMEILGVDHRIVQGYIDAGSLPASYHYGSKPSKLGSSAWHIEAKALRAFIINYPECLHGRNIDIIQIVELLVGIKSR